MIRAAFFVCMTVMYTVMSFAQSSTDKNTYIEIKKKDGAIKTSYKFNVDSVHLIINTTNLNSDTLYTFYFDGELLEAASMKPRKTDIGSVSFSLAKGYTVEKWIKKFNPENSTVDLQLESISKIYYEKAMAISPFKK